MRIDGQPKAVRRRRPVKPSKTSPVRTQPSSDDVHEVVYFQRHVDEDPGKSCPGRTFLREV